jgi:hypothetical protein
MRKKGWLIVLALFLLLVSYVIYGEFDRDRKRKHGFSLVKGEIVDLKMDGMNGHSFDITYKAQINGKEIIRSKNITCDKRLGLGILNILMRRKMDVVYEKNDPGNCELLLSRAAYKEYKLITPKEIVFVIDALEASCGVAE